MKMIEIYKSLGFNAKEEIFNYLLGTLKETIRTCDFFVAWEKVLGNVSNIEIPLNILNSLIGKDNIERRFKWLIREYPEVVPIIPILIALRDKTINIYDSAGDKNFSFEKKKVYSEDEINKITYFAKECGLLTIMSDKTIKNLVDYSIGVEVGIDTNARKNRSGQAMENLIEAYIKSICYKNSYTYLKQATASIIKTKFKIAIPTDHAKRHFDFAIKTKHRIYLIEVNYYSNGGSKLKSVAGEFQSLCEFLSTSNDIGFIWITDGKGWQTAKNPLFEAFNSIDFVMNIKMIEDGILEAILTNNL